MKHLLLILAIFLCFSCTNRENDPYPYTFHSTKNFKGTAVEELARYVEKNDTISIVSFLHDNPSINIDTTDKYFGHTLLMFAIFNRKYESFHCLLNHGASPLFIGDYEKRTPLYMAATFGHYLPNGDVDYRFCKELLERGANPNEHHILHNAVGVDLSYVKLLIEHGADYNSKWNGWSPADYAIIQVKPEIAEYLIIEKKALLYDHPDWDTWTDAGDVLMHSKEKIINYIDSHPEQIKATKEQDEEEDRGQVAVPTGSTP